MRRALWPGPPLCGTAAKSTAFRCTCRTTLHSVADTAAGVSRTARCVAEGVGLTTGDELLNGEGEVETVTGRVSDNKTGREGIIVGVAVSRDRVGENVTVKVDQEVDTGEGLVMTVTVTGIGV